MKVKGDHADQMGLGSSLHHRRTTHEKCLQVPLNETGGILGDVGQVGGTTWGSSRYGGGWGNSARFSQGLLMNTPGHSLLSVNPPHLFLFIYACFSDPPAANEETWSSSLQNL